MSTYLFINVRTDNGVKTLKSLGIGVYKTHQKVQVSTLTKEKIRKLQSLRVIQKTLVYVIGLSPDIAEEGVLRECEYFGQYGDLSKVVVNKNKVYNAPKTGPSYSAYLTYSSAHEAAITILVSSLPSKTRLSISRQLTSGL